MSNELEESIEDLDESKVKSDVENEVISPSKKEQSLTEHAKPRRRRRGKKRKHRKESGAACETENHDECEHAEECEPENHVDWGSPAWNSDEDLSCDVNSFTDIIIRPVNVPKAPENSTQFIMDDHNECRLYMSFETPNPYLADPPNMNGKDYVITEPIGEDAAYRDIDYQYVSPQDFDNTAYYDREFELSYKSNRFEELMRLSRSELITALQTLEARAKELSDDLVKENPSPMLEQLQSELLELQERNSFLKECNTKLSTLVLQNETSCSVHNLSIGESVESTPAQGEETVLHVDTEPCSREPHSESRRAESDEEMSDLEAQNEGQNNSNSHSCEETFVPDGMCGSCITCGVDSTVTTNICSEPVSESEPNVNIFSSCELDSCHELPDSTVSDVCSAIRAETDVFQVSMQNLQSAVETSGM